MNEDLPPGWSHATLQECCTSVEKVDPRHEPDVFFDYIDIRGIQPASGRIEATKRLLGGEAPSRARQKVRAGDIVLSTVRTYQRKSAIVPDWLDGAIASTGFAVLRPRPGIDPRFIFHQLLSDDFVDRLSARQSGSSYPAVRDGDVRTMSVRIAPASQQRSVAAAIEEHFSRLDAVEEGITSAETKCTAMPSLMAAQLFASDWPVRRLEEVAKIGSGATPKRSEARYWSNGIIPWITSAAVNRLSIRSADEFITEVALDETSVKLWPEGTVLMAMYGEGKTRGKAAMLEIESTCNQACAAISYERSLLSGRFLRTYLNVQYEANRRLASGGVQPNLNLGLIKAMEIPVPSLEVQELVAQRADEILSALTQLLDACAMARRRAAALRRSIRAEAFAGRLVTQDLDDEPASELLARM